LLREETPGYGGAARRGPLQEYLSRVESARKLGNDTGHTHRPALKALLEAASRR
jgi:hypothetical protein